MTSAVATAIAAIKVKHDNEMLSLCEMIENSLLVKESFSLIPPPNHDATPKSHPCNDSLSKITTEWWNQADLGYFKPHLNKAHKEGEIVLVGKNVYYRNVIFFVQRLQNLVTFRDVALVKANIASSIRGSALEWYTFELSYFSRNALNNDPNVNNWINTLSHHFKVPTSIALDLVTNKTYTLDNSRARRPPIQYVRAII